MGNSKVYWIIKRVIQVGKQPYKNRKADMTMSDITKALYEKLSKFCLNFNRIDSHPFHLRKLENINNFSWHFEVSQKMLRQQENNLDLHFLKR